DYAVWHRQHLSSDAGQRDLSYWRDHLAGAAGALELPTDRARRGGAAARQGATLPIVVSSETVALLRGIAERAGASRFAALFAAFAAVLARYADTSDIVVGVPFAGRDSDETLELVGFLVNTLPLRLDLHDDPSFAELVERAAAATRGAL